jgi:hypothetical protein
MKARRRHQLQENLLAIEIGKVADFLKRRGNHLATGVLVIAVLIFGYVFVSRRSHAKQEGLQRRWDRALRPWDRALAGAGKPDERTRELTELAEQDDNERIAALAAVELGYEYARRSLMAGQPSEREALARRASRWFLRAIEDFPEQELATAKARFGLGKLRESTGQFKLAAQEYRRAKESSALAGHPVVRLAEVSLARLAQLQTPVRMATTAPATQPASRPATAPSSKPAGAGTQPAAGAPKPVGTTAPAASAPAGGDES